MTTIQPTFQHYCSDQTLKFEPLISNQEWELICYPRGGVARIAWDDIENHGKHYRNKWLVGYSYMMNCSIEQALYIYHYDPHTLKRRCNPAFTVSHTCICSFINLYNSRQMSLEGLEELRQEVLLLGLYSGGIMAMLNRWWRTFMRLSTNITVPNNPHCWELEEGNFEGDSYAMLDNWGLLEVWCDCAPITNATMGEVYNYSRDARGIMNGVTEVETNELTEVETHDYTRDPRPMLEEYEQTNDIWVLDGYTRRMLEEHDDMLIENTLSVSHVNAMEYISLEKMVGTDTPPMYEYPDWISLPVETEFNCKELNAVYEIPIPRYMGRNTYKKQQMV